MAQLKERGDVDELEIRSRQRVAKSRNRTRFFVSCNVSLQGLLDDNLHISFALVSFRRDGNM